MITAYKFRLYPTSKQERMNILARGLEQVRVETEPLPVIRIGKFGQGSKKPTASR